jgi:ribosomal protein L37E
MIKKELIPSVQCKRCAEMHRPDDPMCPNCGYPGPDMRKKDDSTKAGADESSQPADQRAE